MTQADQFESPQGNPLHEVAFRAISEGLDGQGIITSGDFQVSADANTAMGYLVDTGTMWYDGGSTSLGAQHSDTLAGADANDDRWDTIAWDTSTTSVVEKTGAAEQYPEPPDIGADEVLLAYIYVPAGATDFGDSQVFNWRPHHQGAENTRLKDTADDFTSDDVEGALAEVVREAGDPLNGPLDLSSFSGGSVLDLGTNPGAFGAIVDLVVSSNSTQGTEHSFMFSVDGGTVLKVYAESDGAGGVQTLRVEVPQGLRTADDITDDRGNTLYDYSNNEFTQARLGGPASSLSSHPLPIQDLDNPYALPNITDRDLNGNDLTDSAGPGTLYASTAGEFPRGVLDDVRTATVVNSSTFVTSGEEVVLVDTATIGAASTITLASADMENGKVVAVSDLSGSAASYPITVETEGTETIDSASSKTIATSYAGAKFVSDGNNWVVLSPPPLEPVKQVEGAESGAVANGEQGTLIFDHLETDETLEIYKGVFTLADGSPVPTDLNLIIATLDNSGGFTNWGTIFAGDGATIWDGDPSNSIGDPLASFTASSATTVAVLANNQSGASEDIMAKVTGERVP